MELSHVSAGGVPVAYETHVLCISTEVQVAGAMEELQEGLRDLSGLNLRVMTDEQFVADDGELVPILVGFSRRLLDRYRLGDTLAVDMMPEDKRFRVYSQGSMGVFIMGRDEDSYRQASVWLLKKLAAEAMNEDGMTITDIDHLG